MVVEGLPSGMMTVHHYRIDGEHSNTHSVWKALGSPDYPTPEQMVVLHASEGLEMVEPPKTVEIVGGRYQASFSLPVHGVSLITLTPS